MWSSRTKDRKGLALSIWSSTSENKKYGGQAKFLWPLLCSIIPRPKICWLTVAPLWLLSVAPAWTFFGQLKVAGKLSRSSNSICSQLSSVQTKPLVTFHCTCWFMRVPTIIHLCSKKVSSQLVYHSLLGTQTPGQSPRWWHAEGRWWWRWWQGKSIPAGRLLCHRMLESKK